ncbi:MAG: hypothetical protein M1827_002469 [Pycnora praestabilis]|nr:MAG: hypothetical protein M1827_002469 [Pycnora praestabilis]
MAPSKTDFPPVRACLFDMDGLMIDSEDIYTIITNTILREYGKPDLPWDIKAQLQGRPGPEAYRILIEWAQLPIPTSEYISKQTALQRAKFPTTSPLPGVKSLLHDLEHKPTSPVQLALATSSHRVNFELKSGHLGELFRAFPEERRVLGDDPRIPVGKGKPAPDIYLLALSTINEGIRREGKEKEVTPEECLVFEDSVPGVEAGRRAGMRVIWCPHPELLKEFKGREKEVLAGLAGERKADEGVKTADQVGEDIEGKERRSGQRVEGKPGKIDDGWAELLYSLEDFPYERYGIKLQKQ